MQGDRRLMVGLVSLAAALLAVEAALFIADPWLGSGYFQYDADIGFRLKPGRIAPNRFGFNDDDHPLERRPGTARILILGDSFGWFGGVEGNYAGRLERRLQARFGSDRVDVINAGYPSAGPREYLSILKKYGLQYRPDFVLLAFFAGNDFDDSNPAKKRLCMAGSLVVVDRWSYVTLWNRALAPRSRMAFLARVAWWNFTEERKMKAEGGEIARLPRALGFASTEAYLDASMKHLEYCDTVRYRQGAWRKEEEEAMRYIRAIRDVLAARGIGFAVAILPSEAQVSRQLFDRLVEDRGLNVREYHLGLPQDVLRGHLDREGIPYVDMLKNFRRETLNEPLYLPNNTHWNDRGNWLAAESIYPLLAREVEPRL